MSREKAPLRVVIADDEQLICSMLGGIIRADELGLAIIGYAYDGAQLLALIEEQRPDIVITDIRMPVIEGLDIIRMVKQKGIPCRFIVISGHKQFDYAYNALKYDVSDYLLKPIDADELNKALGKIAGELRNSGTAPADSAALLRQFFMKKAVWELTDASDLADVNQSYGTRFMPGLFRGVYVKIDYVGENKPGSGNLSSLQGKTEGIATDIFRPYCADILFDYPADGVELLLNYSTAHKEVVPTEMEALLARVKDVTELFTSLYVTVAVGAAAHGPGGMAESLEQARGAVWTRMIQGLGKVIVWKPTPEDEALRETLAQLYERMRHGFEALDTAEFTEGIDTFFALPRQVLAGDAARKMLERLFDGFFAANEDLLESIGGTDTLMAESRHRLRTAYTLSAYAAAYKTIFLELLDSIQEHTRRQNARPIRQAVSYIVENYNAHLTLDTVAKQVNLSPVYFSNMFKKEMGQNFSEYVTSYRLARAKDLLKRTNLNVNEIAAEVGFQDAKYFSKLFKKIVGISAAEFRKVYG